MEFVEFLCERLEKDINELFLDCKQDEREHYQTFLGLRLSYIIIRSYRQFLKEEKGIAQAAFENYDTVKLNYN